jgi:16S rRNA (uracil1498-N3)-methyltransferase
MSLPTHWVASLTGARVGDRITVEGDEAHHAVAVRRLRIGEPVALTDGAGIRVTGAVAETGTRRLVVVADTIEHVAEPTPRVTVVQAIPKGDRGELAVEVLTEIGVATIVPWAADRSVAVWRGERAVKSLARWRSTAREAAKQARRAWFPEVTDLAGSEDVARLLASAQVAIVLHEEAGSRLAEIEVPEVGPIVVVVGPEGGLTDDELAAFTAAGAHGVRLGAEVLRTSTAGVAAVSALLSGTPRWS